MAKSKPNVGVINLTSTSCTNAICAKYKRKKNLVTKHQYSQSVLCQLPCQPSKPGNMRRESQLALLSIYILTNTSDLHECSLQQVPCSQTLATSITHFCSQSFVAIYQYFIHLRNLVQKLGNFPFFLHDDLHKTRLIGREGPPSILPPPPYQHHDDE